MVDIFIGNVNKASFVMLNLDEQEIEYNVYVKRNKSNKVIFVLEVDDVNKEYIDEIQKEWYEILDNNIPITINLGVFINNRKKADWMKKDFYYKEKLKDRN